MILETKLLWDYGVVYILKKMKDADSVLYPVFYCVPLYSNLPSFSLRELIPTH